MQCVHLSFVGSRSREKGTLSMYIVQTAITWTIFQWTDSVLRCHAAFVWRLRELFLCLKRNELKYMHEV